MGSKDLIIMILFHKKRKNQRKKKDKRSGGWTDLILSIRSKNAHTTVRSAGRWEIDPKSIGAPTSSCSLIATTVLVAPPESTLQREPTRFHHSTPSAVSPSTSLKFTLISVLLQAEPLKYILHHHNPTGSPSATEILTRSIGYPPFPRCSPKTPAAFSWFSIQRIYTSDFNATSTSSVCPVQVKFSEPSGATGVSCCDSLLR